MYFQILALAAYTSQSVIMIGYELEPPRRRFLSSYLWEVIGSSPVTICGADREINSLHLCGLDLVHGNPNPSIEYRILRLQQ